METAATALVLAGVAMPGWAAWMFGRLMIRLSVARLRGEWAVLPGMIACFMLAYLAYLVSFRPAHRNPVDLGVPVIFFLGAENVTDALTGLYNRREFDRRWSAELARAKRFGLPLYLAKRAGRDRVVVAAAAAVAAD